MSAAGERLMEEEFSPQRQMRWIEEMYEGMLRKKGIS
jgi:hypothetical protein